MKKIIAVMLAVVLTLSVGVLFAFADETADVYVTISDKDGKLALAAEKVTVTDIDGDNALTINDALYAAHEQFYEGGAAAGFATETTKYGLSLTKLWGTANGYSYGYMINNASAWSMTDPVKTDDYIAAYVFTDTKYFADKYSYFDKFKADNVCVDFDLTLSKADFDAEWNPITVAVANAELTVDGEPTGSFTNENGIGVVSFKTNGKHIVSAVKDGEVLVPPVCVVNVTGCATPDEATPTEEVIVETTVEETTAETTAAPQATVAPTAAATKDTATKDTTATATSATATAKTGDSTHMYLWLLIALFCLFGAVATVTVYKKHYEK